MMRPIIVVDLTSTSRGLTLIFIKHIWLLRRMEFLLEEPLKCITFQNQLCVQFGSTSGPESYLNKEEERELVQFIEACTDIGFSRAKSQIIELVRVMMHKKKDVNVSLGWWTSFRWRHPHIVLRSPESVSHVRAIGTRRKILQRYFDLLEETFTEYDLYDKPTAIFNMDETGMPLNPVPPKVLS